MDKRKVTSRLVLGCIAVGLAVTAVSIYVWKDKYGVSEVQKETLVGERPRGNCSISGRVVSATTGNPIDHARMYLHYNVTHGSIFIDTARNGTFAFNDIPNGPFSLQMSHTAGYQDVAYNPENNPGQFPDFSLKDGEQRSGIELKAAQARRISGKILDQNGKIPANIGDWTVLACVKNDDDKGYQTVQANVDRGNGSYVVDGLAKPAYVMAINWQAAKEGNASPPVYAPGVFSRSDATWITFDEKPNVDNVDITLKKEGGLILKGTVLDEAGEAVPEAFVVVHRPDMCFDFVTAYTDERGHYQIQGLGDGEFSVHVDAVHRGFVRMRTPVTLGKASTARRDFALPQGVTISGKFVDEEGKDWQIGQSYGEASIITGEPNHPSDIGSGFSLTNFRNKHRPKDAGRGSGGSFARGDGAYDRGELIFPTTNTFIVQGMMPGNTKIVFSPNKEKQKVVKILYNGQDIMESGIETKPGQEIKDVAIFVGTE